MNAALLLSVLSNYNISIFINQPLQCFLEEMHLQLKQKCRERILLLEPVILNAIQLADFHIAHFISNLQ